MVWFCFLGLVGWLVFLPTTVLCSFSIVVLHCQKQKGEENLAGCPQRGSQIPSHSETAKNKPQNILGVADQ